LVAIVKIQGKERYYYHNDNDNNGCCASPYTQRSINRVLGHYYPFFVTIGLLLPLKVTPLIIFLKWWNQKADE
jgi:hypothetical protein